MARRKLSNLDKVALCAMNECFNKVENPNEIKIVFASQYAEIDRLKKLIFQYSQENEVSPATFSASVHNNAVGQFSLLKKIKESYNSISAQEDTFITGFVEAAITNSKEILYCFAEEEPQVFSYCFLISHENNEFELITNTNLNPQKQDDIIRFENFLKNINSHDFTSKNGLFTIKRINKNQQEAE